MWARIAEAVEEMEGYMNIGIVYRHQRSLQITKLEMHHSTNGETTKLVRGRKSSLRPNTRQIEIL